MQGDSTTPDVTPVTDRTCRKEPQGFWDVGGERLLALGLGKWYHIEDVWAMFKFMTHAAFQ